jgi:hypothetical protein
MDTAILRGLIEKMTVTPTEDHPPCIDFAGILSLASKGGTPSGRGVKNQLIDSIEVIKLVAGAGFEPATFRL